MFALENFPFTRTTAPNFGDRIVAFGDLENLMSWNKIPMSTVVRKGVGGSGFNIIVAFAPSFTFDHDEESDNDSNKRKSVESHF